MQTSWSRPLSDVSISTAAEADLGYAPMVGYAEGWRDTLEWFRAHWLPSFDKGAGITGLSLGTQNKIDIQAAGTQTAGAQDAVAREKAD